MSKNNLGDRLMDTDTHGAAGHTNREWNAENKPVGKNSFAEKGKGARYGV